MPEARLISQPLIMKQELEIIVRELLASSLFEIHSDLPQTCSGRSLKETEEL